jgi:hypothetical protein
MYRLDVYLGVADLLAQLATRRLDVRLGAVQLAPFHR